MASFPVSSHWYQLVASDGLAGNLNCSGAISACNITLLFNDGSNTDQTTQWQFYNTGGSNFSIRNHFAGPDYWLGDSGGVTVNGYSYMQRGISAATTWVLNAALDGTWYLSNAGVGASSGLSYVAFSNHAIAPVMIDRTTGGGSKWTFQQLGYMEDLNFGLPSTILSTSTSTSIPVSSVSAAVIVAPTAAPSPSTTPTAVAPSSTPVTAYPSSTPLPVVSSSTTLPASSSSTLATTTTSSRAIPRATIIIDNPVTAPTNSVHPVLIAAIVIPIVGVLIIIVAAFVAFKVRRRRRGTSAQVVPIAGPIVGPTNSSAAPVIPRTEQMTQRGGPALAAPMAMGNGVSRANGTGKGKGRMIETEAEEEVVAGPSRPYGVPREDEAPKSKPPSRVDHGPVRYA